MKKLLIIAAIALLPLTFSAQTVLMEEYPASDTIVPKWGKNLRHFIHLYFSYSMIVDDFSNNTAKNKIPGSGEFALGLRYKLKLTNFYAMGLDFGMNSTGFAVKQSDGKTFPTNIKHKKENIQLSSLSLEYFNRINFDRRGNKIGKFIDIGAYGFVNLNSWHYIQDVYDTLSFGSSKKIEVKYFKPDYLNNYGYGASVRLGMDMFVLTARYRLSDLIKKTGSYEGFPELPRMMVGIQISVH